jgi:parallel beta-helix repeat protein
MPVVRMSSRGAVVGMVTVAAALGSVASAGPAFGSTRPACGDTVTVSTTLRADLRDCPDDGLVIGADGITLDLNGHTVDGDAISGGDDVGIREAGHHSVVIRHGTVQEFDHAVRLIGASHNLVLQIVAVRNGDAEIGRAILLDTGSDWNRIERNDASSNGRSGVAVLDSRHNLIARNRTSFNGVAGMGIFGGADNRVISNVVTDNADNGIFWGSGTTGGSVEGNQISRNFGNGLVIEEDEGAAVLHNRLVGNGNNLAVFGNRNLLRGNVAIAGPGCTDPACGFGVTIEGGAGNVVTGNIVLGSLRDGIRVDTFAPDDLPTTDTVVRDNFVRGAGVDGISVGTETINPVANTRIEGNRVSRSTDDGIDVRRLPTTITGNWAVGNGDLGISALPGTDGGGNHANSNGNAAQCVGVACA